tara:strand:+ start:480 stop:830 length:351 start_codon:yes stop_codon:yes gene_type:complete
METLFLIVSSVLTTLGIVTVIWLISNVRSVQKLSKQLDANLQDVHRYIDEVKEDTMSEIGKLSDFVDRESETLQEDLEKRFDKSYRTMYEFRDWADEQINRLIESDLNNESKKKTK